MKIPDIVTVLAIVVAALVAFAAITTALAHLFQSLGLPRAQKVTERIGIIVVAVKKVAEDVSHAAPEGPVAMGKAALEDLDQLVAAVDPSGKGTLLVARAKTMARALGVTFVLVLLAGCSGPMADVVHLVQVEGQIVSRAEPCLVANYKADQQECIDKNPDAPVIAAACVADVRARWKPIVDALVEEHDTRCKLEPAKCPAK